MKASTSKKKITIGAVIREPASSLKEDMSGWRTFRPVIDQKLCQKCGMCWLHCPDAAIFKDEKGNFKINYKHCKGDGICAEECPFKAIKMIEEKK